MRWEAELLNESIVASVALQGLCIASAHILLIALLMN
jgi:hypothetical protein